MPELPPSPKDIDLVYNCVFEALKAGRQPGSNTQMELKTGLSTQSLRTAIKSLLRMGHLRCWKSKPDEKYSIMHYEIPGESFPSEPEEAETDIEKNWRLAWQAVKHIRALAAQGYTVEEIAKLAPDHIDGTGWAEASIVHVIRGRGSTPNYGNLFKM